MSTGNKFDYRIFRKKMDKADRKQPHNDYLSKAGIVHFDHSLNSAGQRKQRMLVDSWDKNQHCRQSKSKRQNMFGS